jgi:hypothetical protein
MDNGGRARGRRVGAGQTAGVVRRDINRDAKSRRLVMTEGLTGASALLAPPADAKAWGVNHLF